MARTSLPDAERGNLPEIISEIHGELSDLWVYSDVLQDVGRELSLQIGMADHPQSAIVIALASHLHRTIDALRDRLGEIT